MRQLTRREFIVAATGVAGSITLLGCGGSFANGVVKGSITLAPQGKVLTLGTTQNFTATVVGMSSPVGTTYTFSLSGSGSIGASQGVPSTNPVVSYSASKVGGANLSVQVHTPNGDPLGSSSTTIDVTTPLAITPLKPQVAIGANKVFTVAPTAGGAFPAGSLVTWSLTGKGTLSGGNPHTSASVSATYTAPQKNTVDTIQAVVKDSKGALIGTASTTITVASALAIDISITPNDVIALGMIGHVINVSAVNMPFPNTSHFIYTLAGGGTIGNGAGSGIPTTKTVTRPWIGTTNSVVYYGDLRVALDTDANAPFYTDELTVEVLDQDGVLLGKGSVPVVGLPVGQLVLSPADVLLNLGPSPLPQNLPLQAAPTPMIATSPGGLPLYYKYEFGYGTLNGSPYSNLFTIYIPPAGELTEGLTMGIGFPTGNTTPISAPFFYHFAATSGSLTITKISHLFSDYYLIKFHYTVTAGPNSFGTYSAIGTALVRRLSGMEP